MMGAEQKIEVGQVWRSRDKRDGGLRVTVIGVSETHIRIQRYVKTRVRRDRFKHDYELVTR